MSLKNNSLRIIEAKKEKASKKIGVLVAFSPFPLAGISRVKKAPYSVGGF